MSGDDAAGGDPQRVVTSTPRSRARRRWLLAGAGLLGGAPAWLLPRAVPARSRTDLVAVPGGEPWPQRPIRVIVPQAPGGTADLIARTLAERLERVLGVALVVDNRAGANGLIGTDAAKRAAPDGYTILIASTATHAMAPHVTARGLFDPLRDFAPVINLAWQTKVALVSNAVPATTLADFVAYAHERPGKLNYASTGVGSSSHLDAELLAAATGMRLVHIPYRGSGQTVAAITVNEVQLLLASVTASYGAVDAGQARALAVFSRRRSPLLPAVPTIAEAGLPSLDLRTWLGVLAPAETPAAIVDALNAEIAKVLEDAAMRRWLDTQGLEPLGGTPASFDATIRADVVRWGEIARQVGVASR